MQKFWKDKEGKIVIIQSPNVPLTIWFVSMMLTKIWSDHAYFFEHVSFGALFVWAAMEVFSGVNLFRRFLGLFVIVFSLWSRF